MNIKNIRIHFSLIGLGVFVTLQVDAKPYTIVDSIGVENIGGKEVIIHRVEPKESYYALSRLYKINVKDIITLNTNKSLKVGDLIKVPTNRIFNTEPAKEPEKIIENQDFTEYKVGSKETLYTIAKRFQVSVDDIIVFNKLANSTIRENQFLKIPQNPLPLKEPRKSETIETIEELNSRPLPADRYGLTQVNNQGIGVWMENLNTTDGKMLALHKSAPIGTIIKITNPMTQRTTFAKVVGKYSDSNENRDSIIIISKSTANLLGAIDKRFLVHISYGIPK